MIKANIINKVSAEEILRQINHKIDNASAVLVNELKRKSFKYTPYRSGGLSGSEQAENSYEVVSEVEGNRYTGITYTAPYASVVWYGKPNWKYNTGKHPNACSRWVLRAFEIHGNEIIKEVVKAYDEV